MIKRAAFILSALALAPAPVIGAPAADGSEVVYCHDSSRDLVQRVRLRHCRGNVVRPDQAVRLQSEIEKKRRDRQTRALEESTIREKQGVRFKSAGAAFAVNRRGELLTSAHVVKGCDALEARNNGSHRAFPARIKAIAKDSDLAIIQIGVQTPNILRFSGQPPADGTPLALIGYPSEGMIRRTPRMTPVLISHAVSNPSRFGLIGVAGDVRRGNSGGPAIDSRGRAVGVLKAKIDSVAAHQLTGRLLTNLGVVVETGRVLRFLQKSQTPFAIDDSQASEKSGRALFEQGRRAVFRIDCLVRG